VNDVNRRNKLVNDDGFVSMKIFNENLAAIQRRKTNLKLNKPIYVGAAVLDISKWLMYDFHYNFTKKQWPDSELLFTDTDSLVYNIKCENVYQDIYDNKDLFDLSDYPTCSEFHDNSNNTVIGKMKDEFIFVPVREFVGLRSKMYAVILDDNKLTKKAKGIPRGYVKKMMNFDDFKAALNNSVSFIKTNVIRTNHHKLETNTIIKRGLSNFDDKRYCKDGINTLALGHYLSNIV